MDAALADKADAVHNHEIITLNAAPASGGYSGRKASMTVSANGYGQYALLTPNSSGALVLADADALSTMPGFCLALAAGTGAVDVLLDGFITNSAWTWTPRGILYASTTAGAMTQTAPSGYQDQVQVVGIAITATTIFFKPDYVLAQIGLF